MLFRLNIHRSKGLIWTLNVAAILCITLTFFMIYKKKTGGQFNPRSGTYFKEAHEKGVERERRADDQGDININDYAAIWMANISGEREIIETDPNRGGTLPTEAEPIEDIVNIAVILRSKDPKEIMDALRARSLHSSRCI